MKRSSIGMAEYRVSKDPEEVLCILGLGSCVGLCLYDPVRKIGGMVHILLPEKIEKQDNPFKFAETAPLALLEEMKKEGASRKDVYAKISGGAMMFSGSNSLFDIGQRNVEMTKKVLAELGIPLKAEEVGGKKGRSIFFYVKDGKLEVKIIGREVITL